MAKRSNKRSSAARKGAATRKANARRKFSQRSKAAKKGWRRRKAKEKIVMEAKAAPISTGRLREWIVTWAYHSKKKGVRMADFVVIAKSDIDAKLFVVKARAKGKDSKGADLTWMHKIPWDEVSAVPSDEETSEENEREIKALGEGYVELR